MRNIFHPRLFRQLSLRERILHSLVTFGVPLSFLDYFLIDYEEGRLIGLLFAAVGGMLAALVLGMIEHWFITLAGKRKLDEHATTTDPVTEDRRNSNS